MNKPSVQPGTSYVRDRFTWLAYFMLAYFAFTQAALGPAMPFLRAELGLNFTVAGLHFSAFAVGMIAAGLTGAAAAQRWGRPLVFWGGGLGMLAGAVLLMAGRHELITVSGSFMMGLWGTYLLTMIPATLSDHHGARRATALTESNVAASAATILPPLIIGLFSGTAIGWRAVFIAAGLAWLAVTLTNRQVALPRPKVSANPADKRRSTLPRAFWAYWLIIVLLVAAEWSIVAWSADFMEQAIGLERALASSLMSAFFVAMVIGRLAGSRLTTRMDTARLLPGALALAAGGFLLFWLGPAQPLNIIGLFVAGLGSANLFPLSLSVAQTIGADQPDTASARVSLAAGVAILTAPQVLGAAADAFGIRQAMGLVLVLYLGGGIVLALAQRGTKIPGS